MKNAPDCNYPNCESGKLIKTIKQQFNVRTAMILFGLAVSGMGTFYGIKYTTEVNAKEIQRRGMAISKLETQHNDVMRELSETNKSLSKIAGYLEGIRK